MTSRARKIRDVAMFLFIPLVVVAGLMAPVYVAREADENTRELLCTTWESNNIQLRALKRISNELGIPGDFAIPPPPPVCQDFLP